MKKVLIVTNSHDLHADLVGARLDVRDHRPFRLNLDAFPRDYQTCLRFDDGRLRGKIRHVNDAGWLDLEQVGAVWMRKPGDYAFASADLSAQELAFARLETEHALFSLLYTLDCYWMSHPVALRRAQWKGEQLQRAARMGFRIPDSLITDAPDEVRRFRADIAGEMVFKSLSSPMLAAERVAADQRTAGQLRTTIVDQAMMENVEAVGEMPCHFQQYIPKQYELRVTVIGERVFAARIHSQDDERTVIDSRDMSAPIRYEAAALPAALRQRCVDFVRSYDLTYGALDLIVTPDDEVVFLENNPAGQFLYVEQLIPEFKMIDAVAAALMEGARCH